MKCEFCKGKTTGLVYVKVYTNKGIKVCEKCYEDIDKHRHKPYSKVMDKLAMVEASYYANRKVAKR